MIHEITRNQTNSSWLVFMLFRVVSWIALAVCPDQLAVNIKHEETLALTAYRFERRIGKRIEVKLPGHHFY
jgi:hypothetical protein